MSKLPLDLSKFKKVASDDNTSTLMHQDGHVQIKIAHGKINDSLRKALDKLPLHKNDGGDETTGGLDIVPLDPNSPEAQPNPPSEQVDQESIAPKQPQAQAPQQAQAQPEEEEPEPTPQEGAVAAPKAPQQAPLTSNMAAEQIDPIQYKNATNKELADENMLFEHDLNNGHITPMTYHQLFAKKSTPGQIGTLFGLMMSGAGSGLAHQPNAVLGLMQKEIDNDLEAQKQSSANAQNFLRINQAALTAKSEAALRQRQASLTAEQQKGVAVDNAAKAYALSQAQMMQSSFHNLVQGLSKVPPGQQDAYRSMLGIVYSKMGEKINDQMDAAAGASAYAHTLYGTPNTTGEGVAQDGNALEQQFQQRTRNERALGPEGRAAAETDEAKHFSLFPGEQASRPLGPNDQEKLRAGVTYDQQLQRFIDFVKAHPTNIAGLPDTAANIPLKKQAKVLAANLSNAYREANNGGVFKAGEQGFIGQSIDPDPLVFYNNVRVLPKLQTLQSEHRANMNTLSKSYGFSGYPSAMQTGIKQSPSAAPQGTSQTKAGAAPVYKYSNGILWKRGPDGKAEPVQ